MGKCLSLVANCTRPALPGQLFCASCAFSKPTKEDEMDMLQAMRADISDATMGEHAQLVNAVVCAYDCHDGVDVAERALAKFLGANPEITDYYQAVRQAHRNQSALADLDPNGVDIFAQFV